MGATNHTQSSKRKLDRKTRRFVSEYLKDLNGRRAAIRSGYSPANADAQASRMLARPHIAQAVELGLRRVLAENWISLDRNLSHLAAIAYFDPLSILDEGGGLLPLRRMPLTARYAVSNLELHETSDKGIPSGHSSKFRFGNRLQALKMLSDYVIAAKNVAAKAPKEPRYTTWNGLPVVIHDNELEGTLLFEEKQYPVQVEQDGKVRVRVQDAREIVKSIEKEPGCEPPDLMSLPPYPFPYPPDETKRTNGSPPPPANNRDTTHIVYENKKR